MDCQVVDHDFESIDNQEEGWKDLWHNDVIFGFSSQNSLGSRGSSSTHTACVLNL